MVLATGSLPLIPPVDGIGNDNVLTYEDVLNGSPPPFKTAVVIGGGATGLELALYLTENGCKVSIVEMLTKIGSGLEAMTKKVLLSKLEENNVEIMRETKLISVESAGARVACRDGSQLLIKTDRVIFATGTRPHNGLYDKIKSHGFKTHRIGDCLQARNAKAAIYEGAVLGRSI